MDSTRWHKIERLFVEAVGLPAEEQAAFLARSCEGDEELLREIQVLLQADLKAEGFTEGVRAEVLESAISRALESRDPLIGALVGAYRVEERVGSGGMGTVYRAARADGAFEQTVALKVVRFDLRPEWHARFLAERQILANLEHPAIAHLHDGGVTDDGRPWLAMELVDGSPITQYADEARLSINERLGLFRRVCEAVAYAHQNLIVHQDLKPSNILVTRDGEVKLLDFGIAHLLAADEATASVDGSDPMTPEYAAPEQVRGQAITVATDVYALGVLLYELLTGRRPYRLPSRVRHEVERVILEEEPTRPSTAVTNDTASTDAGSTPQTAEAVSQARRINAAGLRRRLAGDLDVIVLKALRKDPARRFPSATAFADDIQRHLEGRPVTARPPTPAYRAGRFARRHRWAVTAAVVIAILLGAYLVSLTSYSAALAAERDRATREARKAGEVADFLENLLLASQPERAQGEVPTAIDLLDRGFERVHLLEEEPEVQAHLRTVIGRSYYHLGLYEKADTVLTAARDGLARVVLAGQSAQLMVTITNNLAVLAVERGDLAEAEALMLQALDLADDLGADDGAERGRTFANLATITSRAGRPEVAIEHYRRAVPLLEKHLGENHPDYFHVLISMGVTLRELRHYDEADSTYRYVINVFERIAPRHPNHATALNNMGMLLHAQGRAQEAQPFVEEAYELRREVMGEHHPETLALLTTRGAVALDLGQYAFAREVLGEAVHLIGERLGPDHPSLALAVNRLAHVHRDDGEPETALVLYERALRIFEATLPPGHNRTSSAHIGKGRALMLLGRLEEAETTLRHAFETSLQSAPAGSRGIHEAGGRLGEVLLHRGRHDEAEPLLRDALEGHAARTNAHHPDTRHVARLLEQLYIEREEPERSAEITKAYLVEAVEP